MEIILAQSSDTMQIPITYLIPIGSVVGGAIIIVVAFLWKQHLKSIARLEHLESNFSSMQGFISTILGMSMNGDTVSSRKIHEAYERFKPSDGSGQHPIIKA